MPRHVRKGDTVMVTAGSSRGTVGEILAVVEDGERVVVKGVNIRTKHIKPTQQQMPIHASNVSPVSDGKPTRVRFVTKPDGSKVRVAARGGKEIGTLHGPRSGTSAATSAASATKKKAKA
jgi:large subunit ribosomal protein L24